MIMKRNLLWGIITLLLITFGFISCGSDDKEENTVDLNSYEAVLVE